MILSNKMSCLKFRKFKMKIKIVLELDVEDYSIESIEKALNVINYKEVISQSSLIQAFDENDSQVYELNNL